MSAIKLISSMAPRELLKELTAQYSANTATAVRFEAAGGVEVAKRVRRGEPFDAVVLARNAIDELAKDDLLVASSITDIAASGIAVAVRADAEPPDISNEAASERIECGNRTAAEIADQQRVTELAEVRRGKHNAPRRIKPTAVL